MLYISQYSQPDALAHHGILGQKWGVRRYQNYDGSLTAAGKKRYGTVDEFNSKASSKNHEATPKQYVDLVKDLTGWNEQQLRGVVTKCVMKPFEHSRIYANKKIMGNVSAMEKQATKFTRDFEQAFVKQIIKTRAKKSGDTSKWSKEELNEMLASLWKGTGMDKKVQSAILDATNAETAGDKAVKTALLLLTPTVPLAPLGISMVTAHRNPSSRIQRMAEDLVTSAEADDTRYNGGIR